MSKIAVRVNSTYSSLTYQPLVLLRHDVSYSQVLALLHVADVFMVTSLREGMNLTCHEYIHCQDGKLTPSHCHGCLILSEFTGSASVFAGYELLVNPWDYRQCADTLNKALEMTPERKRQNWEYLHSRMVPHTAISWCKTFRRALSNAHSLQLSREPEPLSDLSIQSLKQSYERSVRRLFFIGVDPFMDGTEPVREQRRSLMNKLTADQRNIVYVTSDKSPEELDSIVNKDKVLGIEGDGCKVGLVAEDGYFWREPRASTWKAVLDDKENLKEWKKAVKRVMEYVQERTDGTWIQEKRCLLVFRFDRAVDPEAASHQASELADQLGGAWGVHETVRVIHSEGAVTFKPSDTTKATVANLILQQLLPRNIPDFVFVAGAERSDEDLFQWANGLAKPSAEVSVRTVTTILLGDHLTQAKYTLADGDALASLVDRLRSSASSS